MRGSRWGLIGASDIASSSITPAIRQQPGSAVLAVYSRSARRGDEFAGRRSVPRSYHRLEALLDDDDIDAVYVSSTNDLHARHTIAAARAGKHVLCEKPLALTLADASAAIAACRDAGVVLAVNFGRRNDPALRASRDLVRAGAIGTPLAAVASTAVLLAERLRGWRLSDPVGGGVVLDLLVHEVDSLRFVLHDEPVSVQAATAAQHASPGPAEDAVMAVLTFAPGTLASVFCSYSVPYGGSTLELHGSTGSLRATRSPGTPSTLVLRSSQGEQPLDLPPSEPVGTATVAAFEAAIEGEGAPTAGGQDGLAALAAALAVKESHAAGRRVALT